MSVSLKSSRKLLNKTSRHDKVSKRKLISQETVDFFVPLARKLGLEKAAVEFEKRCLEVLKQKG